MSPFYASMFALGDADVTSFTGGVKAVGDGSLYGMKIPLLFMMLLDSCGFTLCLYALRLGFMVILRAVDLKAVNVYNYTH